LERRSQETFGVNLSPEFASLRALSTRLGSDPLLVQAAGGNTSIKQDDLMWIKASGTWLMDALNKDIFVPLDLTALSKALNDNSPDCESCLPFVRQDLNTLGLRPSIETSVHGLMPHRVVLHVHCVNTIAWAIRVDAEQQLAKRLVNFNWSFIPYARPGLQLCQAISKHLKPGSDVMVLQNHGLAVAAKTVAEAETLLALVVEKLRCPIRQLESHDAAALQALCAGTGYRPAQHAMSHVAALDSEALKFGCVNVYYPDHVVFLGTSIPDEMASNAPAVVVPGKGVLVRKDAKPSIEPMLRCLGDVFLRTASGATLKALTPEEIDQLTNWDAEKYRQSLKQP
jgi:rhamnose utilization protein RhaD (predicted bifunctional aldolase and dehydrogenase)